MKPGRLTASEWAARLPWSIVASGGLLIVIGLLAIVRSEQLSGGSQRLFALQCVFAVLAVVAMFAASLPSYRVLCRWSYSLMGIALVLLVAVYFFPRINGAHRWIRLGPIGLQPSELAKLAFVMALARWLMHRENHRRLPGILIPTALAAVPALLIVREPDLGTALTFLPVLLAMLFAAGARRRDLLVMAALGLLLLPVLWSQMSREQKSRVTAVLDQTGPHDRPDADQYHLHRAKQTLTMGSVWGSWWDDEIHADPARYFVPAAATDSIICVIGERFGLTGIAVTLLLFTILVWRCLVVARRTQEPFGRLVAVGIGALIAVQAFINTGMMVGLLPITGLSLPLVSYGGSGLVAHALALGLVLNIGLRPGYEVAGEPFRFAAQRKAA
ncbi:MAG: rod shape-determining protein RodA [Planctomycetota bacterium]|nr:rod shape-determining protein RodA [Planctomycetota bacterium]